MFPKQTLAGERLLPSAVTPRRQPGVCPRQFSCFAREQIALLGNSQQVCQVTAIPGEPRGEMLSLNPLSSPLKRKASGSFFFFFKEFQKKKQLILSDPFRLPRGLVPRAGLMLGNHCPRQVCRHAMKSSKMGSKRGQGHREVVSL